MSDPEKSDIDGPYCVLDFKDIPPGPFADPPLTLAESVEAVHEKMRAAMKDHKWKPPLPEPGA